MEELTSFTQIVRKSSRSLELTIDYKVCRLEGIEEGDMVKVWIKVIKKNGA